ncbi:MAG: site-2 protease family protein [Chloroflexota bacterium]|nr:site-2 protease family protein [Chloroflexota bacterium]
MPGSIRVARLLGIDVRIHFSWFLIFFIVVLSLTDSFASENVTWSDTKSFVIAVIAAVLFFLSVLGHELAHAVVARRFRMSVSSITLFVLGGVANLAKEPPSAVSEFLMASAGPATSLAIGVVALGLGFFAPSVFEVNPALQPIQPVARYIGTINIWLAAFNMLPGFPLDGGRVFRSIVWGITKDRLAATRIAARGGQVVAVLLVAAGVFLALRLDATINGLWLAFIAYFLWNAASSTLQQEKVASVVGGARVGPLMTTDFKSTTPGAMVGQVIRDLVLPMNLRAIPVVAGDRLIGLVAIGDLRKVEQERWAGTPVDEVMTAASELPTVSPDDPLGTALERFGETELPLLPVIKEGRLVGVLYRESVIGYVRMQESLGLGGRR